MFNRTELNNLISGLNDLFQCGGLTHIKGSRRSNLILFYYNVSNWLQCSDFQSCLNIRNVKSTVFRKMWKTHHCFSGIKSHRSQKLACRFLLGPLHYKPWRLTSFKSQNTEKFRLKYLLPTLETDRDVSINWHYLHHQIECLFLSFFPILSYVL